MKNLSLFRNTALTRDVLKRGAFFSILIIALLYSSYVVIQQLWHYPLSELFTPTSELSLSQVAAQITILPTMIVAFLAGGLLGTISTLLQQLVKNTLASDSTLAVGSGAQFTLLIVTLFFPSYGLYGSFWVAFIGALATLSIVFLMSLPSRMNPIVLVLSGLIINIFISALSAVFLVFFSEKSLGVLVWGGGVLTQTSWSSSQTLAVATLLLFLALIPLLKPLSLMSLDDRQAKSLGVPVNMVRTISIIIVATISALVVSEIGILSFIGLAAATLVNALSVRNLATRFVASFILGGVLLLITSNMVMLLEQVLPMLIPAGAMTGILAAPLIIWLILQQKKNHVNEVFPSISLQRKPIHWIRWGLGIVIILGLVLTITQTITGWQWSVNWHLIQQFRLPRSLSAAATGVMLASAGVMLQTFTRNPMASPEVLGVSSGAALGVLTSIFIMPILGLSLTLGNLLIAGCLGSFAVLMLILWLARSLKPSYLLLVGIAISAMMNGVLNIIELIGDPRLQAVLSWLSGTTYSARPETVWWLISLAGIFFTAACLLVRPLHAMSLGSNVAKSIGVRVRLCQWGIILVVACLSATSTLAVGPLSFIGLMVPHLAVFLGAVQLHRQLALSALLGAGLMLIADWIGRYAIFPYEIPAGTIAALIGGVYFIYLIRHLRS
ncbi:Fe(3+)-hydroxamate ABC transporter permease FhuB [Psychrobacter sp. I-STPA6b]|uniref:Fe(3+)-hydroxamate ABC transporter permease FhuB n=1 Tax=Psychrobacter sp. I-STPA6b TaxID=2585718 RepID=UPI001D0C9B28|nr:Fe(3+)-hydroxamate ABC transporter permease FhuB [Psychrobacter sp. I-STPA6b]